MYGRPAKHGQEEEGSARRWHCKHQSRIMKADAGLRGGGVGWGGGLAAARAAAAARMEGGHFYRYTIQNSVHSAAPSPLKS
jgi:hypothetical protein